MKTPIKVPSPIGALQDCINYNQQAIDKLMAEAEVKDIRFVTTKNLNYYERKLDFYFKKSYQCLSCGWIGGEYFQGVMYLT